MPNYQYNYRLSHLRKAATIPSKMKYVIFYNTASVWTKCKKTDNKNHNDALEFVKVYKILSVFSGDIWYNTHTVFRV